VTTISKHVILGPARMSCCKNIIKLVFNHWLVHLL